jgi:hypothetical protein
VAAKSKAWVVVRSLAGTAVSNLAGGMDVCCECCVLSGGGVWDGLITRSEEPYRARCACDTVTSTVRGPRPTKGVEPLKKNSMQ